MDRREIVVMAALSSAGAGLVHAAAAGTHDDERTVALLFALTAAAQVSWAAVVLAAASPVRALVAAGAAINGVALVAWMVSRTVGLPVVDALATVEPIGVQDGVAAVLGGAAALAAGVAIVPWRITAGASSAVGGAMVAGIAMVGLAVPGMAASHTHRHDEAHDHDEAHGHDEDGADGPVISLDDTRLTAAQRDAAEELIVETRAGMAGFVDEQSVLAAGYQSIGDSRSGFEHFVNHSYLGDGATLDPSRIESVVLEIAPDGTKTVVSAMYVLEPGQTMEDVPDIAGELTTWHDHDNLCWDATGTRLAGVLVNGVCRPGGELRVTPPMMHVWMVEHRCGPFAGLDGHGSGCDHSHAH